MRELKNRDEQLTTADLAGRSEKTHDFEDRPRLVRNQQRPPLDNSPVPAPALPTAIPSVAHRVTDDDRVADRPVPFERPVATFAPVRDSSRSSATEPADLFSTSEVGDFRSRWSNIQTGFVDEPRKAVEDADNLVASVMKQLAEGFANERERLEKQWDRGDDVSTEDLRIALQRYRSFFDRLLKV
jgi:hypothetical protein